MVKEILDPVGKMDGDSLPVSAFVRMWTASWSWAPLPMRSAAWPSPSRVGCRKVHPVQPVRFRLPSRHHPSLPLTADEAAAAACRRQDRGHQGRQGQGRVQVHHGCLPAGLHGLRRVRRRLPGRRADHGRPGGRAASAGVFDYCVATGLREEGHAGQHRQGQPVQAALLEFSGSCAGCAETSYARLSPSCSATICISPTPPAAPPSGAARRHLSVLHVNKDGHGPAWCNSLFEDNAEHGLGMFLGQNKIREDLAEKTRELIVSGPSRAEGCRQAWLDTLDDSNANAEPAKAYVKALRRASPRFDELANRRSLLSTPPS